MNVLGLFIGIIIFVLCTLAWGKLMVWIAVELESVLGVIWFAIFGGAAWFWGLAKLMELSKCMD